MRYLARWRLQWPPATCAPARCGWRASPSRWATSPRPPSIAPSRRLRRSAGDLAPEHPFQSGSIGGAAL